MLSVVTMSATNPETCVAVPEVISTATDVATVRADLLADLMISAGPVYAAHVFEWFESSRDVPGMITNTDGSIDVWVFQVEELAA
jgi:hypothetical protein